MTRIAVLVSAATIWSSSAVVAESEDFLEIADSLAHAEEELYDIGQAYVNKGKTLETCEFLQLGGALMMRAINNGLEAELPPTDVANCSEPGFYWAKELAVYHFNRQEFESSREWFTSVLSQAESDRERAKAQNNIGVTYHFEGRLQEAYDAFSKAVDYGIDHLSSINLASISGLSLELGQSHTSLSWSERARERLSQELKEGMPMDEHARRSDLIALSELMAYLDLKNVEMARKTFSRMQMRDAFPGLSLEYVHAAMILAIRADDPSVLEIHRSQIEAWMAADSAESVARLGASVMAFEPWRSDWLAATGLTSDQIWPHLLSLSPDLLPALNPEQVADTPKNRVEAAYLGGTWFFAILGMLPLLAASIFQRSYKTRKLYSDQQLISDIDRVHRNPIAFSRFSGSLSKMVWSERQTFNTMPEETLRLLTAREREILVAARMNERPKLTAERLAIAPKSIYTIRTTLRSKLAIPKEESLETWAQKHFIEQS